MESTSGDIEGWDSLGHLQLLSLLREHFGADYEEDPDLATATSVKEIFDIISR
jgi:acyl carrier protein